MFNLGDLFFSLSAKMENLGRARASMDDIARTAERTAQAQVQAAGKVAAAQEHQMRVLQLLQAQVTAAAQSSKNSANMSQLNQQIASLTQLVQAGAITMPQFNQRVQMLGAQAQLTAGQVRNLNTVMYQGANANAHYHNTLKNITSSAVLTFGPLSGVGARINAISSIAGRATPALAAVIAGAAGAVVVAYKFIKAAVEVEKQWASTTARFKAGGASLESANNNIAYAIELSRRYGLELQSTASAYSRLVAASRGTIMEGMKTQRIFEALAIGSAALRLSADETAGTIRAVEQMMSKGIVAAEELRGQMGDRLVGAFNLAAQSMGKTTRELDKMLKKGEITAEEFLPKLAEQLIKVFQGDAINAADTLTGRMNQISTETTLLVKHLNDKMRVTNALTRAQGWFVSMLRQVNDAMEKSNDKITKYNPALVDNARAAELAAERLKSFSAAAEDMSDTLQEMIDKRKDAQGLLDQFKSGITEKDARNIEAYQKAITMLNTTKLTLNDRKLFAGMLSTELGREVTVFTHDLAAAIAELDTSSTETQEALKKFWDSFDSKPPKVDKASQALKDYNNELAALKQQVIAASTGPEELSYYNEVTSALEEKRTALRDLGVAEDIITAKIEEHRKALETLYNLEKQRKADEIVQRSNAQVQAIKDEIEMMAARNEAARQGVEALEWFNKVTAQVMEKQKQLAQIQGLTTEQQGELLRQYIEQLVAGQQQVNQVAQKMADSMYGSITNGFEAILVEGADWKDSMESIFKDLHRIILRELVFEQLKGQIVGGLTSLLGSVVGAGFGGTAAPITGASASAPGRARGGPVTAGHIYTVGERGKETFIPSVDGTIVPRNYSGGNSGGNVTIIQHNDFTGSSGINRGEVQAMLRIQNEQTKNDIRDLMKRRRL